MRSTINSHELETSLLITDGRYLLKRSPTTFKRLLPTGPVGGFFVKLRGQAGSAALCLYKLKVVSERLGHPSITLTLDTYSHVLPSMQQAASDKLERLLYG